MGNVDRCEKNVGYDVNAFESYEEVLNVDHAAEDYQRIVQHPVPDRIEAIFGQPKAFV